MMDGAPNLDLARLGIVKYPAPVLREPCREVTEFGDGLHGLAKRMLEIMAANRGVGLAAPQFGLSLRLALIDQCAGARLLHIKGTYLLGGVDLQVLQMVVVAHLQGSNSFDDLSEDREIIILFEVADFLGCGRNIISDRFMVSIDHLDNML